MSNWRKVNQQKYWNADKEREFAKKSGELADELERTKQLGHKQMAEMAQKYAALAEAEAQIRVQRAAMRDELLRWVELNGPQTIEGVGTLKIVDRTSYSYDAKAIAEKEPARFAELVELDCVEISRTKARTHERLSWLKRWEIPGSSPALTIDKRDK